MPSPLCSGYESIVSYSALGSELVSLAGLGVQLDSIQSDLNLSAQRHD